MKVVALLALLAVSVSAFAPKDIAAKFMPAWSTGFVIKGQDAEPHAAPYIVSLSAKAEKPSHICGGTIVNKNWIVTAAHCISKPVGMGVIAGLHERGNLDSRTQTRVVDFGKIHEKYTGGVGPYDIAYLHVSESFEFNRFVQPAALPAREEIHAGEIHLYGWGQPKAFTLAPAKTLQTVETEIVEWNECRDLLPANAPLAESNICSDSKQKGISACNGDSGGPLVVEHPGAPSEIVGIVSWGYIPCGSGNMPSIYTRVSAYVDWMLQVELAYNTIY